VNRAFSTSQFWDGRAGSLEEQAKGPMIDSLEMGNRSHEDIVARLKAVETYRRLFMEAFGTEDWTIDHVAKAIATFERTLLSGNSPFDRYRRGDESAMSPAARRGFELFSGKARCITCHKGFNFTDEQFHTLGSEYEKAGSDLGLYRVTRQEVDRHKFKTPTLREISNTGPYMHDGRFRSLVQVVDFYDRGGLKESYGCAPNATATTAPNIGLGFPLPGRLSRVLQRAGITSRVPNSPSEIKPLNLSGKEKKDLVEFLRCLSGEGWQQVNPSVGVHLR
jgi:cytochrome c peroxidase